GNTGTTSPPAPAAYRAAGRGTADMAAAAGGENMLTREQLLHLFSRFSFLTSLPEVKQRIADAVRDKQEAVAVTTEIQEEILREMGVDPSFGIGCLGKVNLVYENDKDLMIKFYQFVANVLSFYLIEKKWLLMKLSLDLEKWLKNYTLNKYYKNSN
ncbi:unnamed protein product, partial [Urochloa humidicola]